MTAVEARFAAAIYQAAHVVLIANDEAWHRYLYHLTRRASDRRNVIANTFKVISRTSDNTVTVLRFKQCLSRPLVWVGKRYSHDWWDWGAKLQRNGW